MSKKTNSEKHSGLAQCKDFPKFKLALDSAKRVLISTHQLPDGDGLGAEVALYHYLKRAKKTCRVYNPDPLPKRYRLLDPKENFLFGPREVELWDTCDLWIIVDTNDPRRLGKVWSEMSLRAKKIVFIDHHQPLPASEGFSYPPHSLMIYDTETGSIAELLYDLFDELNLGKITKDIALGLYVSVMTDTNSFRYARTTPHSHRIAAKTIELGINPEEVYQSIFSSKEVQHLHLLGSLLQSVKVSAGGKLAWMELSLEARKKHRATVDDTQSFMNLLLLLKDAEVVCLFRQEEDGKVRISMKSKGQVVVSRVASEFGGGGHEYAAGMAVAVPFETAVQSVTHRLVTLIDSFHRFGK